LRPAGSAAIIDFMATIPEAFAVALEHHQAGRLAAAEQIYRQILAVDPNQPDAIHLLGVIAHQVGKPAIAVEYIERAIRLNGTDGIFHCNLGNAFLAQGKLVEAIACCRRGLKLRPDNIEAHCNLGNALTRRSDSPRYGLRPYQAACGLLVLPLTGFSKSIGGGGAGPGVVSRAGEAMQSVSCQGLRNPSTCGMAMPQRVIACGRGGPPAKQDRRCVAVVPAGSQIAPRS
jgi:hypothetical protein